MSHPWTLIAAGHGKTIDKNTPIELVDPYENWEKKTRPASQKKKTSQGQDQELWQPVYVEITPGVGGLLQHAATLLLKLSLKHPSTFRIDLDTHQVLSAIANVKTGQKPREALMRFFVYRNEDMAYLPEILTKKGKKIHLPYRVLLVGPAIPASFVESESLLAAPDDMAGDGPRSAGGPVVTAVIDDMIGIANERFRSGRGTTRVAQFWAQGMPRFPLNSAGTQTGISFSKEDIEESLDAVYEEDFYRRLYPTGVPFYSPNGRGDRTSADYWDPTFHKPYGFLSTHGTHVLDLAAGYPVEEKRTDRPIAAVQLPKLATLETWGARLDVFILMAVRRILFWADNWQEDKNLVRAPVVINISYGSLAGPKDGTGFLEAEIAKLVRLRNNGDSGFPAIPTCVVLSSGNGYRAGCHAEMTLQKGQCGTVTLRVQPEDLSVSFVEIWIDDLTQATLDITPPVGPKGTIVLTEKPCVVDWQHPGADSNGIARLVTLARVYASNVGPRTRVTLALAPTLNHDDPSLTAPPGSYLISLTNTNETPISASLEVQRDDSISSFPVYGRQSYFDHENVDELDPETLRIDMPKETDCPVMRTNTLSSLATAESYSFVVIGGAFDRDTLAYEHSHGASLYTGSGVSGRRIGPDFAAVSEETRAHPGIMASGTFSGSAAIYMGTSAAAPLATRAIVNYWSDQLASSETLDLDRSNLLNDGTVLRVPDKRLGVGILPFNAQPGRIERRLRG